MKAILISIKPKWVAKILNGEKTIEVRKKFPKDFEGWVYIYCTKEERLYDDYPNTIKRFKHNKIYQGNDDMSGKVVARFYCDRVWVMSDFPTGVWDYSKSIEENHKTWGHHYELGIVSNKYLHKYDPTLVDDANTYSREYGFMLRNESCLSQKEIYNYLNNNKLWKYGKKGYAIHISDLVIFNKPKWLIDFKTKVYPNKKDCLITKSITKAPQSYMFIEVD